MRCHECFKGKMAVGPVHPEFDAGYHGAVAYCDNCGIYTGGRDEAEAKLNWIKIQMGQKRMLIREFMGKALEGVANGPMSSHACAREAAKTALHAYHEYMEVMANED